MHQSKSQGGISTVSKHLFLTGGTIITCGKEPIVYDGTIEIRDGRIVDIRKGMSACSQKDALVVDISGQSVLPGLIDMHTHLVTEFDAIRKLLLAHGVTSVRDVETNIESLTIFRSMNRYKKTVGPRVFSSGPFFGSTPSSEFLKRSFQIKPVIIDHENDARLEVEKARRAGFDIIEVNFNVKERVMKAIASSANELGIPTFADLMFSREVFASHAMEAGIKALDHASGIAQLFCNDLSKVGFFEEWESVDIKRALTFADNLAKTGIALIPTLVWFETQSTLAKFSANSIPLLRLLPKEIRNRWVILEPSFGMQRWTRSAKAAFERIKEFLSTFVQSGGKVVTGTDTPQLIFPGISMHREIELLSASGLTPMQALQAATRNPAELLNANYVGTIERGKLADLLIVDGNPLDDLRGLGNIKIVVKDGKIYYPQELLKSIEKWPFSGIDLFSHLLARAKKLLKRGKPTSLLP